MVGECGGSERMGVWHVGGGVQWLAGDKTIAVS